MRAVAVPRAPRHQARPRTPPLPPPQKHMRMPTHACAHTYACTPARNTPPRSARRAPACTPAHPPQPSPSPPIIAATTLPPVARPPHLAPAPDDLQQLHAGDVGHAHLVAAAAAAGAAGARGCVLGRGGFGVGGCGKRGEGEAEARQEGQRHGWGCGWGVRAQPWAGTSGAKEPRARWHANACIHAWCLARAQATRPCMQGQVGKGEPGSCSGTVLTPNPQPSGPAPRLHALPCPAPRACSAPTCRGGPSPPPAPC